MGWFYGFKFHLVINDREEILNFLISQGNMGDREPVKREGFIEKIVGKLFEIWDISLKKCSRSSLLMAFTW